jgi:hypothetical protein
LTLDVPSARRLRIEWWVRAPSDAVAAVLPRTAKAGGAPFADLLSGVPLSLADPALASK